MMRSVRTQLLAMLLLVAPALPGASDPLDQGLRHCAAEGDAQKRLACFDDLAKALPQIKSDQFGMSSEIKRRRDPVAAAAAAVTANESLAGTIAGLRQTPGGAWVFTLDNGQQWIEAEHRVGLEFAVGDKIQIEHAAMGSLWLKADRHRQTRVKRIQ